MGILPIGFFSPLPLAMMIPFMATQSLAMGEAFGKSFQYGKRKISSMSNEEFNKLTFHDLMVEQTANIKAIVPELTKQMSQSKEMQGAIFQEMVNLIPTFFDSLFSALDPKHIENPSLISQASPPPPIIEIRGGDRRPEFNDPAIAELQKQLDEALKQQGTKESLADKNLQILLDANRAELDAAEKRKQAAAQAAIQEQIARNKIQGKDPNKVIEGQALNAWNTKLTALKTKFINSSNQIAFLARQKNSLTKAGGAANLAQSKENSRLITKEQNNLRGISSQIRAMSNDYRHPNNLIRNSALQLRQEIAQGIWK